MSKKVLSQKEESDVDVIFLFPGNVHKRIKRNNIECMT